MHVGNICTIGIASKEKTHKKEMNTTGIHRVNIDYTAPPAVVHVKSYVVQIIRRQMCAQIIPDDKP